MLGDETDEGEASRGGVRRKGGELLVVGVRLERARGGGLCSLGSDYALAVSIAWGCDVLMGVNGGVR